MKIEIKKSKKPVEYKEAIDFLEKRLIKVSKKELKTADEIFLSGTAAEITPIIKIDKKKIASGKVGDITKLFMDTYSDIVMNKNKKYSNWLTAVY